MKRENFVTLLFAVVGMTFFGLGMCMCLLPEWNAFRQGVIAGTIGLALLLVMVIVRRKMQGKPPVKLSAKTVCAVLQAIAGTLALGVGMCMTMVWEGMLVYGIMVGLAGILLLLFLIPLCRGLHA